MTTACHASTSPDSTPSKRCKDDFEAWSAKEEVRSVACGLVSHPELVEGREVGCVYETVGSALGLSAPFPNPGDDGRWRREQVFNKHLLNHAPIAPPGASRGPRRG